ncbi:MAG: efflux RND transporter periplasmic adaptor subunit [Pseudomonadota bacterium]
MPKKRRTILVLALALLLAIVGVFFFFHNDNRDADRAGYRFGLVEVGRLVSAISSSGTLKAVVTVQVGSQVSGLIKELTADFNSEVKAGQIIARLDPENFQAKVQQAEAELAVARTNVSIQKAAVEKSRAELDKAKAGLISSRAQTEKSLALTKNAKIDLDRKKALLRGKVVSRSEIDAAEANFEQSAAQVRSARADEASQSALIASQEAQVRMSEAQVDDAAAQVLQKEAVLKINQVELDHTIIRSPVDGVIIDRSVDVGQTVAASLQAPTLFTIAQDLGSMQVEVNVDEADIGQIQPGQRAFFTVDSYPGREFEGRVVQIRKAAVTVQNVVTYTVIVSAENHDLKLLPGMTANIRVVTAERPAALKVPNAAFRFRPPATEKSGGPSPAAVANRKPKGPPDDADRAELPARGKKLRAAVVDGEGRPAATGRVYIPGPDGRPQPVDLVLGINDDIFTEILPGSLAPGQKVIIGTSSGSSSDHSGQNSRPRMGLGF